MRSKLFGGNAPARLPAPEPKYVSVPVSVGVRDDGELFFQDQSGQPLVEHLVVDAKKQHGDAIRSLIHI